MKILKDSPIKSSQADLFNRGRIVESIVETVKNRSREDGECYTIGIYGKWGEGKTSLLNMIYEKIVGENDIKIIHFNPWLFKDQESLLLDFFKALQKGQISRAFVNKIKQYGPLVSLGLSGLMNIAIPGAGVGTTLHNSFKEVTNAISNINVDIRELKNDLNEKIKLSKKHLLIMIDDVDRLDNEELHAVFKLIRQNADFVNTTYIIAMDVDMVAKSIGQRFEDRNEQSGKHFLEKIVQVPIYLPKIQSAHLNKFLESCLFTQFQKLFSLGTIKSIPSLEDLKELLYRYVFPLFTTVREAILYSNSIAFILPMVYQEVNLGDLCLLEVLKLFHPSAYNTIKASRHILTGSMELSVRDILDSEEKRKGKNNNFIDDLMKNADPNKKPYIDALLQELLYPFIYSGTTNRVEINNKKRICSSEYFNNANQYLKN
jgi:predicted KAP-like P-loop ATPase